VINDSSLSVLFLPSLQTGLMQTINDEGVWRISRRAHSPIIEVYKAEETGHGDILTDEFKNWRIKLGLDATEP
jgi:RAT1-interacting protein